MSSKLSKKQLDLLIERVLSENFYDELKNFKISFPTSDYEKNKINSKLKPKPKAFGDLEDKKYIDALKKISSFDGDTSDISAYDVNTGTDPDNYMGKNENWEDIETIARAIDNDDSPIGKEINKFNKSLDDEVGEWKKTPLNDPKKKDPTQWKSANAQRLAAAFKEEIEAVQDDEFDGEYIKPFSKDAGGRSIKDGLTTNINTIDDLLKLSGKDLGRSLSVSIYRFLEKKAKTIEEDDSIIVKSFKRLKSLYTVRKAQNLFLEKESSKAFFVDGAEMDRPYSRGSVIRKFSPDFYKKIDKLENLVDLLNKSPENWETLFNSSDKDSNPWGAIVRPNYVKPGDSGKDSLGFTMNQWEDLKKNLQVLKRQYNYIYSKLEDKSAPITDEQYADILKITGLDLKSLADQAGEITGMDIFATKDVFKQNFEKAGITMDNAAENAIKAAQQILLNAFKPPEVGKDIAGLKEVIDKSQIMNIDDLADLFKGFDSTEPDKPFKVGEEEITADEIIQQLTAGYGAVEKDPSLNKTQYIRPILASIRDLIAGVRYFKSGRQIRTKSGTEIGFSLGTAETSGTARTSYELQNIFSNVLTGDFNDDVEGFKQKFQQLSGFLNEVSRATQGEEFKTGDLKTAFSRFVALEILNKNIFRIEEASAQGFLFEAFLAMFLGGTQTGADRGGSDFKVGDINGSAKFISEAKFSQSKTNLEDDKELVYVIAITSAKSEGGVRVFRKTGQRLSAIDIHIMTVRYNKGAKMEFTADDGKGSVIKGAPVKTQIEFSLSDEFLSSTFATTLDFSFMLGREFEDFSSEIMSKIQKNVDNAFNSMTSLRNNITNWVLGDNVVAASQVGIQKDRLDDSIVALDEDLGYTRLEEKKSKKDLDNLIKEVILKRLLK